MFVFAHCKYTLKPIAILKFKCIYVVEHFNLIVNGEWTEWTTWTMCTVSCGSGTRQRDRQCVGQAHGGELCPGPDREATACNEFLCPGIYILAGELYTKIVFLIANNMNFTTPCDFRNNSYKT